MKELNIEKLKFIKKLASEYRLSTKNICKLLGLEPTEENQQYIYNLFMTNDEILRYEEKKEFIYLNYETTGEEKQSDKISYTTAQLAVLKMQKALLTGDKDLVKQINDKMKKIDKEFADLRRRPKWIDVTPEEILTISKYRVKHALSKNEINRLIGIGDGTLTKYERLIESEFWKTKIKKLNEYNFSLCHVSVNERKKKRI